MGVKGDKLTKDASAAANSITEKLSNIGGITSKKMFGGHGIFHEGKMFGIIDSKAVCYFKADESNKEIFVRKGAHQHSKMPYYSIPDSILQDNKEMIKWAKMSIKITK